MAIYLTLLTVLSFFSLNSRLSSYGSVIGGLLLIFIIGFRFDIGVDWVNYVRWFSYDLRFNDYSFLEPGFVVLSRLSESLNLGTPGIFTMCAFLTILPLILAANRFNLNPSLVMIVFFIFGGYFFTVSAVRQAIAAAFFIYALTYLHEGKKFHYLFILFLASFFHNSAIFLMPLIFINLQKIYSLYVYLCLYLSVYIIGFTPFSSGLADILANSSYLPLQYNNHLYGDTWKTADTATGLGILVKHTVFISMVIFCQKYARDLKEKMLFNIFFIGVCFSTLAINLSIIARVAEYFLWSSFLLIPSIAKMEIKTPKVIILSISFLGYSALFIASALKPALKFYPYASIFGG